MGIFFSRNYLRYWPVLVIALLFGEVYTETPVSVMFQLSLAMSFWLVAVINLGSLATLNGICVTAIGLTELFIPRIAKIAYGQSADSRLLNPELYYNVLVVWCFCLFIISYFFKPKPEQKQGSKWVFNELELKIFSWVGCFWMLFSEAILTSDIVTESPQIVTFLSYAGSVKYFGFCCAIAYRIRKTKGLSNLSAFVVFYGAGLILNGVFGFWKAAMLTPPLLFILVSVVHQFRWRKIHILIFSCFFLLQFAIVSPATKLGHSWVALKYGTDPDAAVVSLFADLMDNPTFLINEAKSLDEKFEREAIDGDYYGYGQTFIWRITTVGMSDLLMNYSKKNDYFGAEPFFDAISIIPRSVRGVPRFDLGNFLARELNFIDSEDFGTGIAFSFFSTAYAIGGWASLLMITFILLPSFFWVNNKYVGPMKNNLVALGMLRFAAPTFIENSADYIVFYVTRIIPVQLLLIYVVRKFINFSEPNKSLDEAKNAEISQ